MKNSIRASALVLAVAAGAVAVPLATVASAALAPTVSCAKVNAPPLKGGKLTSTFASCTPAALAAGGGSVVAPGTGTTSGKLVMTITWKGGKGTTKGTVKYAPNKTLGKCSTVKGTSRVTITGSVISSTGAAAIIKKGEPISGSVCAISTAGPKQGQTVIEPGTKFKL